jgi:hypothetical protein
MAALIVATFGSSPLAMLRSSRRWYRQRRTGGEHRGERQATGATCDEEVHFNVLHMMIAWRSNCVGRLGSEYGSGSEGSG